MTGEEILEGCELLDKFMENELKLIHHKKQSFHCIQSGDDEGRLFGTDDDLAEYLRKQDEEGNEDVSDEFLVEEAYMHGYVCDYDFTPWDVDWNLLMEVVNKLIEVYGIHVLKHYHRGAVSQIETFREAIRRIKRLYENGAINE